MFMTTFTDGALTTYSLKLEIASVANLMISLIYLFISPLLQIKTT